MSDQDYSAAYWQATGRCAVSSAAVTRSMAFQAAGKDTILQRRGAARLCIWGAAGDICRMAAGPASPPPSSIPVVRLGSLARRVRSCRAKPPAPCPTRPFLASSSASCPGLSQPAADDQLLTELLPLDLQTSDTPRTRGLANGSPALPTRKQHGEADSWRMDDRQAPCRVLSFAAFCHALWRDANGAAPRG